MHGFRMRMAVLGVIAGGLFFTASPAHAEWPTFDALTHLLLSKLQDAVTGAMGKVSDQLTGVQDKLTAGFTQNANYAKAQIGAQQQITDASNMAMARFLRDQRNAQMRDEHVVTPANCAGLIGGESVSVSAGQSWRVSTAIAQITDPRGEAGVGTPAWAGQGQALSAVTQLHLSRYCSQAEQQAGLCSTTAQRENADQRAASLIGTAAYDGQDGINAANDYATTLIQPVPPAAERADQLTSVNGQDSQAKRRNYNARMSLARAIVNDVIAAHTPSVVLTDEQKQEMQELGLTPTDTASWLQAMELEVDRRTGGSQWHASLQYMPPKSVIVEIATELALGNYLAFQNLQKNQQIALASAALLADRAETDRKPGAPLPSPQLARAN